MKTMLKVLSVLQIIVGVFALIYVVLAFAGAQIVQSSASSELENQLVILFYVQAVFMLISGIFSLACGITGLGGAKGNAKKLSTAVKLGWVGLILAILSAAMTVVGDISGANIISAICGCIIPVLFLVSAIGTRNQESM